MNKQIDWFEQFHMNAATLVALKVNELVNKSAVSSLLRRLDIEQSYYDNGREQGVTLICAETNKQVSFSENRNSDDIVVYYGKPADFDESGVISEEKFRSNAKYFRYGQHEAAAKFVIMHMGKRGE